MDTNTQVAQAWAKGKAARSGNMHTDGQTVWSYGSHVIGTTVEVVLNDPDDCLPTCGDCRYTEPNKVAIVCSYSQTTRGKHVNALLAVADGVEADKDTNKAGHALIKNWPESSIPYRNY